MQELDLESTQQEGESEVDTYSSACTRSGTESDSDDQGQTLSTYPKFCRLSIHIACGQVSALRPKLTGSECRDKLMDTACCKACSGGVKEMLLSH